MYEIMWDLSLWQQKRKKKTRKKPVLAASVSLELCNTSDVTQKREAQLWELMCRTLRVAGECYAFITEGVVSLLLFCSQLFDEQFFFSHCTTTLPPPSSFFHQNKNTKNKTKPNFKYANIIFLHYYTQNPKFLLAERQEH